MEIVERYIQNLMDETTFERPSWNIEKIRQGKMSDWDYIDGCMMLALLENYFKTGEKKYFTFCEGYISHRVEADGTILGYNLNEFNLDNINGAKNLLTLYEQTGREKYKLAAQKVYEQVKLQPRTSEGSFWHKEIYPNQVWLDGLYMVMPFYVRYANMFLNKAEKEAAYDDVYNQFFTVERSCKDDDTGLYFHAYDASREMYWCNKETGCSPNFWLRSLGWFAMALLDTLTLLDDTGSERYKHLLTMFQDYIDSLIRVQSRSGMWYQLPALIDVMGNYKETSGSSILSYCILKGVRLGMLDNTLQENGIKAFNDTVSTYLKDRDGRMGLGGICLVAGLGGKNHRDGSVAYYLSEPIVEDDAKGTAPFILAYLEMREIGKA